MEQGQSNIVTELRDFRAARGLTFEQAAELVVVDGKPATKASWHAWEHRRKVPSRKRMTVLCQLVGAEPGIFYPSASNDATAPALAEAS